MLKKTQNEERNCWVTYNKAKIYQIETCIVNERCINVDLI